MLRGSCLCGTVRYEITGTPLMMYYCHCRDCRKATGSAFATNILVSTGDLAVVAGQERLTAFESSPNKYRHFCGACGSPIFSKGDSAHFVSVRSGTLDDDPATRPQRHFYVGSKAAWFDIHDDLPQLLAGAS